jgi:hypothetical protein
MRENLRMNPPHPEASIEAVGEIGAAIAARVVEHRDGANEPPRMGYCYRSSARTPANAEDDFKDAGYASTHEDRALSRKSKVSCSILPGRRALAGERGNESATPNLGSPTTRLRPTREANLSLEKRLDGVSMRSRTVRIAISVRRAPVAATPAIGQARSMRRLTPRPRGSDRRLAALTRAAQGKASEIVRRIQGSVSPRAASNSVV